MALTASTLITAAKRISSGVAGRQKVSNARLIEELNNQESLVVQLLYQNAPDLLTTVTGSATVTLSKNQSGGYTLENGIAYRDFVHVNASENAYQPITVVQRQWQYDRLAHPAIMVNTGATAGVAYPIDPQGDKWQSSGTRPWFEESKTHTFEYSYLPAPTVLTGLASTLTSPDMARPVFVAALELAIILGNPALLERHSYSSTSQGMEVRVQQAASKYQMAMQSLLWQAYKFTNPQGSRGSGGSSISESAWVTNQVSS